ncbi:MAG TPA: sulfur carrier protein ThiS [Acidimicrobiales bacterium]|nr:sulfur carrier protein ThiS [Acidimicrobiales bacterium]
MITVNGVEHEFSGLTVVSLLEQLSIETRGVAVAVNGVIVTRSNWPSTSIPDQSAVEILTAAAGG